MWIIRPSTAVFRSSVDILKPGTLSELRVSYILRRASAVYSFKRGLRLLEVDCREFVRAYRADHRVPPYNRVESAALRPQESDRIVPIGYPYPEDEVFGR